jgi:hypothetical protein
MWFYHTCNNYFLSFLLFFTHFQTVHIFSWELTSRILYYLQIFVIGTTHHSFFDFRVDKKEKNPLIMVKIATSPCLASKVFFQFFKKNYYCCTGGYIVIFMKVFTLFHSWIHTLYHSPLPPPPSHAWNGFNRSHFSIFIQV